jgi:RNA polymerase sigma-70 factor (ECF subfamily)
LLKPNEQKKDFKSIVEIHQEKVRNTCFRFVNNSDDADDVTQEVFIQVYESLSHFRNESELSTWIYRIAVNKSLDFIRRKKRAKRFAKLISLFGFEETSKEIVLPVSGNPHTDLEDKERKQILDWAIDKLPEKQQTAIKLSKYEGFSNKEIAEIMELSLSAVEGLIHRAKKNLHNWNWLRKSSHTSNR